MPAPRTLAILIFQDVEVLDFCGPFEVFSAANQFTDPPAFNVLTVAERAGPIVTRGGLSVNPHHRITDCPQPNLLLVPGGRGTRKEMDNPVLAGWIRQASEKAELVLSVCTGALVLARAGLLDGLGATTHHGAIDLLRRTAPTTTVHADRRFVDNGRVVCSAGCWAKRSPARWRGRWSIPGTPNRDLHARPGGPRHSWATRGPPGGPSRPGPG